MARTPLAPLALSLALSLGALACSDDPQAFNPGDDPGSTNATLGQPCSETELCRAGLSCIEGACGFSGDTAEGDPCRSSPECSEGLFCEPIEGLCQPAGDTPEGASCSSDADCQAGLFCQARGLSGVCAPGGSGDIGAACSSPADCVAGLGCQVPDGADAGACVAGPQGLPRPFAGVDCSASRDEDGPFRFYFEVPDGDVTEFYRLPFPNDIRLDSEGRPDLSGHPTPGPGALGFDVVARTIEAIESGQKGFGTNQGIFIRSSATLDFETLVANGDGVNISIVDITPSSPGYKSTTPLSFRARGGSGSGERYICQNWMVVRPFWGRPLRRDTTYAVIVGSSVRSADGEAPVHDAEFGEMFAAQRPAGALGDAWDAYAPLRGYVAEADTPSADDIAVAAVFTTGDPWEVTSKTRAAVRATPVTDSGFTLCDDGVTSPCDDGLEGDAHVRGCFGADPLFHELHTTASLPILQAGQAPYLDEGGEVSSPPRVQRREDVCVSVTVPKLEMPADGWPVVVYAHGTGGTSRNHVPLVSGALSSITLPDADGNPQTVGAITVGWDQVQHFTRRGDSTLDPEPLVFNYANPEAARGNFIQAAADLHAIVSYVESLDVAAGDSPTGAPIKVDPSKIYFFGHSQGGTSGPIALPFEPAIKAAALSGAGGGLILALLGKKSPVDAELGLIVALQDLAINSQHPVLNLIQGYFEPVDPINYGQFIGDEVVEGVTSARHVFHIYGVDDTFTPPSGMKALARVMRAIFLEPILDEFTGGGVTTSPDPLTSNRRVGDDRFTVGGKQYAASSDYDGHFTTFREDDARADWIRFFGTAIINGAPTIGE
jgi:hypothetical protein